MCSLLCLDPALSVKIIKAGFVIEMEDKRLLTEQQVRDFYHRIADQVRKLDTNEEKLLCFQAQPQSKSEWSDWSLLE